MSEQSAFKHSVASGIWVIPSRMACRVCVISPNRSSWSRKILLTTKHSTGRYSLVLRNAASSHSISAWVMGIRAPSGQGAVLCKHSNNTGQQVCASIISARHQQKPGSIIWAVVIFPLVPGHHGDLDAARQAHPRYQGQFAARSCRADWFRRGPAGAAPHLTLYMPKRPALF